MSKELGGHNMTESPVDRYLELILRQRTDLSREEVLRLIEEKKKDATVSEKYKRVWAALMVAHELGVKFEQDISDSDLKISDLSPGMSGVNVKARIISIFPSREFSSETKLGGRLVKLLIGDRTGWASLIIWRDKVDLVESQNLKPNDVVYARKAYCKEGRFGRPELHIGQSGVIMKLRDGGEDLPVREEFYTKPSQLRKDLQGINIMGSIIEVLPITEFKRFDGTTGKVRRVVLADESTNVTGSIWNELVDKLSEKDVGKMLYVALAKVREGRGGEIEFVADRGSHLELGEESKVEENFTPISQLDRKQGLVNIKAIIYKIFPPKVVRVMGLGERRAQEVILCDDTDCINLTIWGDKSFPNLREGAHAILRNAKIRKVGQEISLTMGVIGNIEIVSSNMKKIQEEPKFSIHRISELKAGMRNVIVEGLVSQPINIMEVATSSGELVQRATSMLADDTGEVQVVAWREAIEKIRNLRAGSFVRLKWVTIRSNPFNGKLDIIITSNTDVDVQKAVV
jgi:replication factor A1